MGLGEEARPREGELVVVLDGRRERLLFSGRTYGGLSHESEVAFGEATRGGRRLTVRFRSTDELNPTRLPVVHVASPYECP
jgi:hypothetical protein